MIKPSTKIYMGITGVALIGLGIVCLCYPGATVLSISWLIGLLTLISGVSTIFLWAGARSSRSQGGAILLSGILEVIFGLIFINHNLVLASVLPIVFAIWLLVEGISISIRSADYKAVGFRFWWVLCILGIGAAVLGFLCLREPLMVGGTTISIIAGISIILLGTIDLLALFGIKKFEKARWGWINDTGIDEQ